MTLVKTKRQELPIFGDMMMNLLDTPFFKPVKTYTEKNEPSTNVFESDTYFKIQLATPGMQKDAFSIELKSNLLIVSGNHKETKEKEKCNSREFNFTGFKKSFKLPKNADEQKIDAKYQDGILELIISKKTEKSTPIKKIKIN